MSLADAMNQDMFGDGTGNSSKDIDGLGIMIDSTGTYGNIVRSANSWWAANETAVSGVLALQGATGMRRMYNDCSLGRGRVTPDFMITTQAIFEEYETFMDPNMRFTNTGSEDVGFKNLNLMFRGKPIFWDDYCDSGVMYFNNSMVQKLVVMSGRDGGVSQSEDRDKGDFRTEPFQKPVNQDGRVAKFFWMGNLTASNCRLLGKLTTIS
jgi:hypothetical protein